MPGVGRHRSPSTHKVHTSPQGWAAAMASQSHLCSEWVTRYDGYAQASLLCPRIFGVVVSLVWVFHSCHSYVSADT